MVTTVISATSTGAPWNERSKAVDTWTWTELVDAFGSSVFSIAKHITQNDDRAAVEVCLLRARLHLRELLSRQMRQDQ